MKNRITALFLCVILSCLVILGCSPNKTTPSDSPTLPPVNVDIDAENATQIGQGIHKFRFDVVDKDGKVTPFIVNSNETFVGQALQEAGLLEGTFTAFGIFVSSINGISVSFEADHAFWGFYINGVFADENHRVDQTEITDDLSIIYSYRWTNS